MSILAFLLFFFNVFIDHETEINYRNFKYRFDLTLLNYYSKNNNNKVSLLQDSFKTLYSGSFSSNIRAHKEYHFLPELQPKVKNEWRVASFYYDDESDRAFKVMTGIRACAMQYMITGDKREEIVIWDPLEIWIYT